MQRTFGAFKYWLVQYTKIIKSCLSCVNAHNPLVMSLNTIQYTPEL